MSNSPAKFKFAHIVALVAVLWLGCFYGLGAAGVFDLDEGLYTSVSRQMVDSGNWLVPKIGSQVFFDKPPLVYWLQASSIKFFGPTSFAVRLPSALASLFTALALFLWTRKRGSEKIGWLAAVIFAISPLTIVLSRQAITDSLLTLWFTLAVIGWIEGNRGERRGYILMGAAAGFATMTKGAIGILLPGAAFIIRMLVVRDFKELKRVPWLEAFGLYLLVVLPWHLALWRLNGSAFINEYVVHQQMARFLGKDFAHNQPFWFYIPILLLGAFPWSASIVTSWLKGVRSKQKKEENDWILWGIWAAVVFGFFSISKSKLPGYIQPAIPALSILVAWRSFSEKSRSLAKLECTLTVIGGILLGGLFTTAGVMGMLWRSQSNVVFRGRPVPATAVEGVVTMYPFALSAGIVFLLGMVIIIARRKSVSQVATAGVIAGTVFAALLGGIGLPAWSSYNIDPLHTLAKRCEPALEKGEKLIIYHFERRRPSLLFVAGHTGRISEIDDTAKPNEPEALKKEVEKAGTGYILTESCVELPSMQCNLQRESTARRWILWRFTQPENRQLP